MIEMSGSPVPAHDGHHRRIAPTTRLGRLAVFFAIVSGVGWLIALPAIVSAPTDGAWWPWGVLLLVGLIPGISGAIAAPIFAFLAMVRRGERALAVFLGYVPVACLLIGSALDSLFFG